MATTYGSWSRWQRASSPCMCLGSLWSCCWRKMQPGEVTWVNTQHPGSGAHPCLRHTTAQTQALPHVGLAALVFQSLSLFLCLTDYWTRISQGCVLEAPEAWLTSSLCLSLFPLVHPVWKMILQGILLLWSKALILRHMLFFFSVSSKSEAFSCLSKAVASTPFSKSVLVINTM